MRLSRNDVMASVVQRFVENSLGGSVSPFIAYLSDSELTRLKDLVQDIEARRSEGGDDHSMR